MGDMDSDVVLRHGLDADPVRPLHHQPVDADIFDVAIVPVIRISRDDAGFVDIIAAIAAVQAKQRQQVEEIDVLVDRDLLPGRRGRAQARRKKLEAADELEELILSEVSLSMPSAKA